MARRQTLDPDKVTPPTRLGPGDSSDSGSDLAGSDLIDEDTVDLNADDIAPDRIVPAEEAGLGGGLDQAEEAQLGVTDEELARRRMARN